MSPGLVIVLIIVLWLFVLAPWLLRSQRPVSHTGEAFEDTRVLFEGDAGTVAAKRRPKVLPHDAHRGEATSFDDADYELVHADEVDRNVDAHDVDEDETIDGEIVHELPRSEVSPQVRTAAQGESEDPEDPEDEALLVDDAPDTSGHSGGDGATAVTADSAEVFTSPAHEPVDEEAYPLDESYVSPVDLMYPGAIDHGQDVVAYAERDDAAADQHADDESEGLLSSSDELSEEELEFAQRRTGRGGWDPVADKQVSEDRYQRRQRTLIGLAVAVVATVALGIVVGGWTWAVAAVAGVLTVIYLVALRTQVRQEQALRRRRVRHLRRARLGVRHSDDEELDIPRNLRRPGAVVLEIDDESPDFDYLPLYDAAEDIDEYSGTHTGVRRPVQRSHPDELAARRVG